MDGNFSSSQSSLYPEENAAQFERLKRWTKKEETVSFKKNLFMVKLLSAARSPNFRPRNSQFIQKFQETYKTVCSQLTGCD